MSNETGSITWIDLMVEHAEEVKNFYNKIVGWQSEPVAMGDYDDFNMIAPGSGQAVAGICHARGANADLPAQWLIYISVADVDESAAACVDLGGKIITEPKQMGKYGRVCVIEDPAGAVAALFEPAK